MTAIIRPAPQVFRRTLPLMVVFGAFEGPETGRPASLAETTAMSDMLETARRYRWPLAFWRRLRPDGALPPGHWLPGCRPRVMDRVFEGRSAAPLDNREFRAVLSRPECTEIFALGLRNDSSSNAFRSDVANLRCRLVLVPDAQVLLNCSGEARNSIPQHGIPVEAIGCDQIRIQDWKKCLRKLE